MADTNPLIAFPRMHSMENIPLDGERMKQRHRLVLWEEWILEVDE